MKKLLLLSALLLTQCSYTSNIVYMTKGSMYHIYSERSHQHLRDALAQLGYELRQAESTDNLGDFAFLIQVEASSKRLSYPKEKVILLAQEPLNLSNHNPAEHQQFGKIITWRDDLVDNQRYLKYYIYRDGNLRDAQLATLADKQKLCVFINANKMYSHPDQLYTARLNTIKFFNQYPQDFDMYGPGWDAKKFKTYKGHAGGTPAEKIEYLKKYKFCICYENVAKMPGYLSEKIIHCLQAGCVPVYWGDPNITRVIPENCFISREKFRSDQELYYFLKQMPNAVYQQYLNNIQNYLKKDPRVDLFSTEYFISIVLRALFGN